MQGHQVVLPNADEFRDWLFRFRDETKIKPASLCNEAGVSINSVSKFLRREHQDLRMTTASSLHAAAKRMASEKGVEMPDLALPVEEGEAAE